MADIDFSKLRKRMVNYQLLPRGITDRRVIAAFKKVAREEFVPENEKKSSYEDSPLPIGEAQTISQPYMVALMTQILKVKEKDKVLEVGTGSGYQTAVLCELSKNVFTVERVKSLYDKAEKLFLKLGYKVSMKLDDGSLGWQEQSPFDKIIVTAAAETIPMPLINQLAAGGKMVIPIGDLWDQRLMVIEKAVDGKIKQSAVCGCVFVPLIGEYGIEKQ